jgi:diguanylate cyclase (GGDEF)-like protein
MMEKDGLDEPSRCKGCCTDMRNKLLIIFVAFAAVPVLALACLRMYTDSALTRRMYADRLRVVASAAAATYGEVISKCMEELRLQAMSWNMREFLLITESPAATGEEKAAAAELVRQNFMRYSDTIELFDDYVLLGPTGTVVLGGSTSTVGRDLSGMEYFTGHLRHAPGPAEPVEGAGHIYGCRAHDSLVAPQDPELKNMPLSLCMRNGDGSLRYVLVGFINAKKLGGIASGITFGETGTAYLIDANNYIFNHSEARFVNTYTVDPDMAGLIGRHLAGELPREGLMEFALDGIPRLYYYNVMPDLKLAVILRQNASELGDAHYEGAMCSMWAALLMLGLSAAAALVFAGKLTAPVLQLRERLRRGREGGGYEPVDANIPGEPGDIAEGYNALLERLGGQAGEIAREKEKNAYLASHDLLTGLWNRQHFEKEFGGILGPNRQVGLVMLRLEQFKDIGDSYGPLTGDLVLKEAARRLRDGGFEACARLSGAHFMLAKAGGPKEISEALQALGSAFEAPFEFDSASLSVGFSSGAAVYPQDGLLIDLLISNADIALSAARALSAGTEKGERLFYSTRMREELSRKAAIAEALRGCVAERGIFLMYQPFYSLSDNSLIGFEALMRVRSKQHGLISPKELIPVAEKDPALIVSLGDWVLAEACRFLRRLSAQKGFKGFVSVNIFPAQLREESFADKVLDALKRSGASAAQLQLEITEQSSSADTAPLAQKLQALRGHGVTISLDDFGSANSSLFYISRLPLDIVKVDQAFFAGLHGDKQAASWNRAVHELANRLGMRVSAERLENQGDCDDLKAIGFEMAQGYLFNHPMMENHAIAEIASS